MNKPMSIAFLGILSIFLGAFTGTSPAQKVKGGKGEPPEAFRTYAGPEDKAVNAFMTERIVGSKVRNMEGEDLGTIEDIVIDIDTGQVLYAVMDFGGFLGIGGKLFPVPWRSLAPLPSEGIFFLDISRDKLKQAPAYDRDSLPDMGDTHWGTKVADFYRAPRGERISAYDYGVDYGYGYGLGIYPSIAQQDPFAETFDPESIKTITGEVIKVENVIPKGGNLSQTQVELIVLASKKEPIPVYLGPAWYVTGPNRRIPFKSGDRITATGSWITARTEPFMIAAKVVRGTWSLKLRRKNGSPVWNAWEEIGLEINRE